MPSRVSAYEMAKKSIASKLAEAFGIAPHRVLQNYFSGGPAHATWNIESCILLHLPSNMWIPTQPPSLVRTHSYEKMFASSSRRRLSFPSSLRNGERPRSTITILIKFKSLQKKRARDMLDSSQWLLILAAGAEHLVTVSIFLPPAAVERFKKQLSDAFLSESFSDLAKGWNEERNQAVRKAIQKHLAPVGVKWTQECLREEVEEFLGLKCSNQLHKHIDIMPYLRRRLGEGDYALSVLAVSWGKGDHHKDPISMVSLSSAGRLRTQAKIDNLHDTEGLDKFHNLVTSKKPDLIAVGDFAMSTMKLGQKGSRKFLQRLRSTKMGKIYHCARAAEEFGSLSLNAKYCVGLAQYIQSPLNDFAVLGSDITAIAFEEEDQHLVLKEKLALAFEHVLVDVTDAIGVNINGAMSDSYYNTLRA
ncbi:hypothetical protein BKA70DRAFT_1424213 [Coprinopsis sp. MPI-PUGE-AT-0042]|nr:hypothetical protein BKA70DRAFT_1424213 [Coprinopsis sp. MPI-PUGE-AT-0042]